MAKEKAASNTEAALDGVCNRLVFSRRLPVEFYTC